MTIRIGLLATLLVPTCLTAQVGLRIELGVPGEGRAAWEGEVRVSAGTIGRLELWDGGNKDSVNGPQFRVARAMAGQLSQVTPQLFLSVSAPASATVELETNQGSAQFALSDMSADQPIEILNGKARVWEVPATALITQRGRDHEFPSAATAPDGSVWLVYASYKSGPAADLAAIQNRQFDSLVPSGNGDSIFLVRFDGKQWSAAREVTEGLRDVWRPSVAVDGKGQLWVTWSEQHDSNWDLYQRRFDPKGDKWSSIERLTKDPGSDINTASTRDSKGNVWWTWQAWRGDNFDILLASSTGGEPFVVASSAANEWSPSIAADSKANVYVGWDSYAGGNYDVFVRRFGASPRGSVAIADTAYFEARASIACDSEDRLWVAYEEDEANWGKDYANRDPNRPVPNVGTPLYLKRRIRVKVLVGDRLLVPGANLAEAWGDRLDRPKSFPRLLTDASNNVWLFIRHHARPTRAGELWSGSVTRYDGRRWLPAQALPASDYHMDNRPALARWKKDGIVAVYASDARLRGARQNPETGLYAATLKAPPAGEVSLVADNSPRPRAITIHARESEDVARMRSYRIPSNGKSLRLLRGEFHRHTELTAHRDQDGGLEDMWRYGLDAAALNWIGNGDHDNGRHREYIWWMVQKVTDLFHNPPEFVPPYTHERSVLYPNGHRNVMFSKRGVRPLPRGPLPGTAAEGTPDTKLLYAYLRHFEGICSIHTSGTRMGTDWRDNDSEVEPVVEIYQGHRNNYEHYGAPRAATPDKHIGGYQSAGHLWNAWARGYRLGIQASSDHVSTHISYGVALAEDTSREAVVNAFRQRHSYGATDNIVLDVRSGEHIMGDEFTADKPIRLEVKAIGTGPIRRAYIIKDNGYMYETGPSDPELSFTWQDIPDRSRPGSLSYYYVRIEQEDGQLAWSSPIWIHYK